MGLGSTNQSPVQQSPLCLVIGLWPLEKISCGAEGVSQGGAQSFFGPHHPLYLLDHLTTKELGARDCPDPDITFIDLSTKSNIAGQIKGSHPQIHRVDSTFT